MSLQAELFLLYEKEMVFKATSMKIKLMTKSNYWFCNSTFFLQFGHFILEKDRHLT